MGLIKLIILVALVVCSIMLWRRLKAWQNSNRAAPPPVEAPRMVRCAHCQLHLPQQLAIRNGETWYCCNEHRDAGVRASGRTDTDKHD